MLLHVKNSETVPSITERMGMQPRLIQQVLQVHNCPKSDAVEAKT